MSNAERAMLMAFADRQLTVHADLVIQGDANDLTKRALMNAVLGIKSGGGAGQSKAGSARGLAIADLDLLAQKAAEAHTQSKQKPGRVDSVIVKPNMPLDLNFGGRVAAEQALACLWKDIGDQRIPSMDGDPTGLVPGVQYVVLTMQPPSFRELACVYGPLSSDDVGVGSAESCSLAPFSAEWRQRFCSANAVSVFVIALNTAEGGYGVATKVVRDIQHLYFACVY